MQLDWSNYPNAESNGLMFTVKAMDKVTITDFDIVSKKDEMSKVMVFTKNGSHVGYSTNGDKNVWEQVYDGEVSLQKNDVTTIQLPTEITIGAGSEQAFYIYSQDVGLMYHKLRSSKDEPTPDLAIANGSIEVSSVVGTKKLFQDVNGSGAYTGGIRYVAMLLMYPLHLWCLSGFV